MTDFKVSYINSGEKEADNFEASFIIDAQDEAMAKMDASDLLKNRAMTNARITRVEVVS